MADCAANVTSVPATFPQLAGPLLIGYELNWALFGVLAVQTYFYSQASFKDNVYIQGLVYGLFLLETVQTMLITHDGFHGLILSWGNVSGLESVYLMWLDLPIFIGIASTATQTFYAWRIYILSCSKFLTAAIVVTSVVQCGGAFAEGVLSLVLQDVPKTQVNTEKSATIWLVGTATCDIIIASSMVYFLWNSRTGIKKTDFILNRLMLLVIETGSATAAVATLELIFFWVYNTTTFMSGQVSFSPRCTATLSWFCSTTEHPSVEDDHPVIHHKHWDSNLTFELAMPYRSASTLTYMRTP